MDYYFDFYLELMSKSAINNIFSFALRGAIISCIINNNYKILHKLLESWKEEDRYSPGAFYESLILGKLEFSDLLLEYMDMNKPIEFNLNNSTIYQQLTIHNIHLDAGIYIHDLVFKKGVSIDNNFIKFYIEKTIEHDKFDVFCYIIEKFPQDALIVGNKKIFNIKNASYLLKLLELESKKI